MDTESSERFEPPSDCWTGTVLGVYYDQLPHWVMDYGCYAFTFHCADSLPSSALGKLKEIVASDLSINSSDDTFLELSRQRFKMMEYYLDQSHGACPLKAASLRESFSRFLNEYEGALRLRHWVVMPNHLHLLSEPLHFESLDEFKKMIKGFKMKSTAFVNRELGRSGKLWMASGYDRWVRNEVEYQRWVRYLRDNPVKAKLCSSSGDWIGLK